jgi:hypothetical protein
MKNVERLNLILKVEKSNMFVTIRVSISTPSFYFSGTYGQSLKLAKKQSSSYLVESSRFLTEIQQSSSSI